jgi:hypothetical protein
MNVLELKQIIKDMSAEIKAIKTQLRQDHRTLPNAGLLQSKLSTLRGKIRAYYYLYAFLRGRAAESVERGGKLNHIYTIEWYALKALPEEAHGLFKEWLKTMK